MTATLTQSILGFLVNAFNLMSIFLQSLLMSTLRINVPIVLIDISLLLLMLITILKSPTLGLLAIGFIFVLMVV